MLFVNSIENRTLVKCHCQFVSKQITWFEDAKSRDIYILEFHFISSTVYHVSMLFCISFHLVFVVVLG